MSLIKEDGQIQLECDMDGCNKCTPVYQNSQFHQMINVAKRDDWQIFKKAKGFVHYCCWLHAAPER